jgi:hypothetical protein
MTSVFGLITAVTAPVTTMSAKSNPSVYEKLLEEQLELRCCCDWRSSRCRADGCRSGAHEHSSEFYQYAVQTIHWGAYESKLSKRSKRPFHPTTGDVRLG